ncbi:MAG: hypothetical protein IKY15_01770 [Clostridia bacterium]|nr:hypothetical protein [Clostridia bacterium]
MIILKTELNKEDYEYISTDLKMLIQQRDLKNKSMSKPFDKTIQEKNYDKMIIPLAEKGQVEAMQVYCDNLSPVSTLNSKIVSNFHKLEHKSVKEPREYLALSSFYNWFVEYYKYTYKSIDVEGLEEYKKSRDYYRLAGQQLHQIGKTDPIAKENAFLMQKRNRENMTTEEYLRAMSNSRNAIYVAANRQTNENPRLKLMIRYCQNLIVYAPDNEFHSHQSIITNVIASVQKKMIMFEEMRRS